MLDATLVYKEIGTSSLKLPIALIFTILTALQFSDVSIASAQNTNLKIVESSGLTRAEGTINKTATVEVIVVGEDQENTKVFLNNIDGFKGEKGADNANSGRFVFNGVTPGTWRIIPDTIKIKLVKILSD